VRLFNSLEDARALMEAAKGAGKAVIIGAGFSGLECAYALRKRGMAVSVVEMEDRVLPKILDADMSPPVEGLLKDNGVELFLRSKVAGIERMEKGIQVGIAGEGGENKLPSDIAVLCLGVRPELSLAGPAGLKVGRGIVVGPDMQSSVPGIFAAGDVAEFEGNIPATWLTAAIQGAVAASNMAGGKARFSHLSQVNVATLFGVPVVGIGTPAAYLKGATGAKLWTQGGVWRKLITQDGKVAGYQSVGDRRGRGLVSLLSNELKPLQEVFARGGLHHPALSCAAALGLRQGRARASSRIRKPRGTRRA